MLVTRIILGCAAVASFLVAVTAFSGHDHVRSVLYGTLGLAALVDAIVGPV